jgi:hypothetical protein
MSAYTDRIERYLRNHPGADRTEARGHSKTPEHPDRAEKNREKYSDYLERRTGIERQLIAKKDELFRASDKYRNDRSARNVRENPETHKPYSMVALQKALNFLNSGQPYSDVFDLDDREDWESILWYH